MPFMELIPWFHLVAPMKLLAASSELPPSAAGLEHSGATERRGMTASSSSRIMLAVRSLLRPRT